MNENEVMVTTEAEETTDMIESIESTSSASGLIKVVGGALLVAAGAAICKKLKSKNKDKKPKRKLRLVWVEEVDGEAAEEVELEEFVEEEADIPEEE